MRKIVAKSLGYAGHEVIQATDGKQGMDLVRTTEFDVVITDLIMPEQEGVETIAMLRTEYPRLPIIAISGGGNTGPLAYKPDAIKTSAFLQAASDAGADLTLTKPFSMADISEAAAALGLTGSL